MPDLNQQNPEVARYLIQNALWWAEQTGVDGYRLDTFPYVPRRFWSEWHAALHQAHPKFTTIGEVFDPNPDVTAFFVGGRKQYDGVDSGATTVFDYPMYFALRGVILNGDPVQRFVNVLGEDWLYTNPSFLVTFLGNHDVRRFISEPGSSDQKLKLAFSLLLTVRGIPQIYYGDEIGMAGGEDPDNRRDFPGGFPGDAHNAFEPSGRTAKEREIFEHVQRLLDIRHKHSALRSGRQWNISWSDSFYAFARQNDEERILVLWNNADQSRKVILDFSDTPLAGGKLLEPLLNAKLARVERDQVQLTVAPRQIVIYLVK